MASLTAIFGNSQSDGEDSEKLLELYWNRAELKKEFASLRDETFKLKDRIKEEQGNSARVQQQLDNLENLLLDPDWVHNVVVYYQLRALHDHCSRKVARFAEQLKQQHEKREHGRLLEAWQDKNRGEASAIEEQLGELRVQMQQLEERLQAERQRYSMMGAVMRFFRKRSVTRQLDEITADMERVQADEADLHRQLECIGNRDAPDTQGLTIVSKRSINFMILAFAQQLYLHFRDDNLASLAKETADKGVGAFNYGGKADCDFLLERVREQSASVEKPSDFADILQHRAKMIGEAAIFTNDDDAVPAPGSVATLYMIDGKGTVREKDKNLLGENYWGVSNVLSR